MIPREHQLIETKEEYRLIQTDAEAYEALNRELRGSLTEDLFAMLVELGMVTDVTTGDAKLPDLVNWARRIRGAGGSGGRTNSQAVTEASIARDQEWQEFLSTDEARSMFAVLVVERGMPRSKAIELLRDQFQPPQPPAKPVERAGSLNVLKLWTVSTLLAKQADLEQAVQDFRRAHLADGLLSRSDVRGWLKSQSEKAGGSAYWYQMPFVRDEDGEYVAALPEGVSVVGDSLVSGMPPGRYGDDWTFRTIDYVTWSGDRDRLIVPKSGVLPQLRQVVSSLLGRYPWTEAQTTTFVLTSHIPVFKNELETKVVMDGGKPLSSRIEMKIDPTTPPTDVLRAYKSVRTAMIGRRKVRPLSFKQWRLVLFNAEVPTGMTWEQKRLKWNHEYPADRYKGYQYTSRYNFWRDANSATKRIAKTDYSDVESGGPTSDMLPPVYEGEGIH